MMFDGIRAMLRWGEGRDSTYSISGSSHENLYPHPKNDQYIKTLVRASRKQTHEYN